VAVAQVVEYHQKPSLKQKLPAILALVRLRQKDCEFEDSLGELHSKTLTQKTKIIKIKIFFFLQEFIERPRKKQNKKPLLSMKARCKLLT
jgi:hypothetical protein